MAPKTLAKTTFDAPGAARHWPCFVGRMACLRTFVTLVGGAVALASGAACSSASPSAGTAPEATLRGGYVATSPGPLAEIHFLDETRYFLRTASCRANDCIEQGTYRLDRTASLVLLRNEATGSSSDMPLETKAAGAAPLLGRGESSPVPASRPLDAVADLAGAGPTPLGEPAPHLVGGEQEIVDLLRIACLILQTQSDEASFRAAMRDQIAEPDNGQVRSPLAERPSWMTDDEHWRGTRNCEALEGRGLLGPRARTTAPRTVRWQGTNLIDIPSCPPGSARLQPLDPNAGRDGGHAD